MIRIGQKLEYNYNWQQIVKHLTSFTQRFLKYHGT